MQNYAIITDSSCDLPAKVADEIGIHVAPLTFLIDGVTRTNYLDERELSFTDFYNLLRKGKTSSTSAVNVDSFTSIMEKYLSEGKDILYIGFSSALSGTFNSGSIAAEALREKYPERKIYTVDSLAASLGQGLLVYLVAKAMQNGMSIDDAYKYAEDAKLHICHWFTVDDLQFLRRGGRIPTALAMIGTVLNIKPVMHMDDNGKLVLVENVRGRKAALKSILKKISATSTNIADQTVFISHGDCYDEVSALAETIKEQFGVKEVIINHVGPVIGSHTGPGVISVFFIGTQR